MKSSQLKGRLAIACVAAMAICISVSTYGEPEPVEAIRIGGVVQDAAFSPDERHLAVACLDGAVRLFEVETWELVWEVPIHDTSKVSTVAFTPDGTEVLAATPGNAVIVFLSLATGRETGKFDLYSPPATGGGYDVNAFIGITALAISPDGSLIAAGCRSSGHVKLVDSPTGTSAIVIRHRMLEGSASLSFSNDGMLLASYGGEQSVVVNTETQEEVATPARPGIRMESSGATMFSPDGSLLAIVGGAKSTSFVVYDTETWTLNRLAMRNDGMDGSVAFSSEGDLLAVGGDKLSLWSTDEFSLLSSHTIPLYRRGGVTWMEFSSDKEFLFTAGGLRGFVEIWRVNDLLGE